MAKISVIVPVYKVEPYIHKCVDSILQQSFRDYDLILVDDGSPDTCPQICDAYVAQDARVAVIHKENGGLSDARNAGIDWAMKHSDSIWLAFVDSDDYLHPDYLMTLYQTALKETADLVICDFIRVDDKETVIEEKHEFIEETTDNKRELFTLMINNWRIIPAWNKLYDKKVFSQLRFAFGKIHEDDFAIHSVLWNCNRVALIADGLYYYRIRENSIMKTETPKSRLDAFEALVLRYEFCLSHQLVDGKTIPTDYLHTFFSLKRTLPTEEKNRFDELKQRFATIYFSNAANRRPKRWFAFYFNNCYRDMGNMYHKLRAKIRPGK